MNPRSEHRPAEPTKAQRPSSRFQTSRRTAAGMWRALGRGWTLLTRPPGAREFRPLEMFDEQFQRTAEDLRWITVRDDMAEQILGPAQSIVRLPPDRELHLEAFWCKGRDDGTTWS